MNKINLGYEENYNAEQIEKIKKKYLKEYLTLEKTRRSLCNLDTDIDYIKEASDKFKNEYLNNCYYFYYCIVNDFNIEKLSELGEVLKTSPAKIRKKAKIYFENEANEVEHQAYRCYEKRILNQELNFDRNCTEFCINHSYNMKKIKTAAKNLDLTPEELIERVNDYKSKYKEETKLIIQESKKNRISDSDSKTNDLSIIFTNKKSTEIIEKLYLSKVNANDLSIFINDYFNNHDTTDEIKERLNYIYSEYRTYSIVMKRKEEYKPLQEEQRLEIKVKPKQEFIKKEETKVKVTLSKKKSVTPKKTKITTEIIDNLGKIIAYFIDMGIEMDKGSRKFELLDYYQLTNLSFDEFLNLYRNTSQREQQILNNFFRENDKPIMIDEQSILKRRDSYFIDGREQQPTDDDKVETISYLKSKQIPLNQKIYNQTMTRLLKGNLYEDTKQENIKELIKSSKK